MRELYDAQVYQQQRQQEAEKHRRAVEALTENAEPNALIHRMGTLLVNAGEAIQHQAERPTQRQKRRAYRRA